MTLIQIPIDHFHVFGNEIPKTQFSNFCLILRASKTCIWSSKTPLWTSRTHIWGVSGGGLRPPHPLWRLRRASSWYEGVLNTGRACPAPAKCGYLLARPAKCAFPSLLLVLFCLVALREKAKTGSAGNKNCYMYRVPSRNVYIHYS